MKEREHLTKNQIAGYRTGGFDALERQEIGRHLLKCDSCRRSLPAPTFDDFWNAVMTERETELSSVSEELDILPPFGFSLSKIFGSFSGLAWSGAALAVLSIFSLIFWLNLGRESNQGREVAQTFNAETADFNAAQVNSGDQFSLPQDSGSNRQVYTSDSNRSVNPKPSQVRVRQKNLNSLSQENISRNSAEKISKNTSNNISPTRGGGLSADCNSTTSVETEIGLNGEAVTLKWKKVPNAVKYHLYVSDDEEILIEEYETEQETSYVMKKKLDSLKDYSLKVLVTLEDRKTIIADSRKFNIKDLHTERNKTEMKKKNDVRCTQTNLLGRG